MSRYLLVTAVLGSTGVCAPHKPWYGCPADSLRSRDQSTGKCACRESNVQYPVQDHRQGCCHPCLRSHISTLVTVCICAWQLTMPSPVHGHQQAWHPIGLSYCLRQTTPLTASPCGVCVAMPKKAVRRQARHTLVLGPAGCDSQRTRSQKQQPQQQ